MSSWRIRFEPAITPVFRTWWRARRGLTVGVRGVVANPEGAVLLVRHTYTRGWHLPGGGVERGETVIDALRRELEEEAGVAAADAPILFGCYSNHANFPNDHVLVFQIPEWRACLPRGNGEIAERGFFALDELPHDTTPGARRRLDEIYRGAAQSALW